MYYNFELFVECCDI